MAIGQAHQDLDGLPVGHQYTPGIQDFLGHLADHGDLVHPFLLQGLEDPSYLADVDGIESVGLSGQVFMGTRHQADGHCPVAFFPGTPDHVNGQMPYPGQYS